MSHFKVTLSLVVLALGLPGAGCTSVPDGYTRQQWAAMSPAARKQVLRQEATASQEVHRALARDAATENGFYPNSRYSR